LLQWGKVAGREVVAHSRLGLAGLLRVGRALAELGSSHCSLGIGK